MFRHSIAMAMYKKGVPLSYICDFLGHENIDTVRIYAYADNETISKALSKVDHEEDVSVLPEKNGRDMKRSFCSIVALSSIIISNFRDRNLYL